LAFSPKSFPAEQSTIQLFGRFLAILCCFQSLRSKAQHHSLNANAFQISRLFLPSNIKRLHNLRFVLDAPIITASPNPLFNSTSNDVSFTPTHAPLPSSLASLPQASEYLVRQRNPHSCTSLDSLSRPGVGIKPTASLNLVSFVFIVVSACWISSR